MAINSAESLLEEPGAGGRLNEYLRTFLGFEENIEILQAIVHPRILSYESMMDQNSLVNLHSVQELRLLQYKATFTLKTSLVKNNYLLTIQSGN